MEHLRPTTAILILIVVVLLTVLFLRGIWLRLEWGASGFVAGLLCGALLALEVHERRKHK